MFFSLFASILISGEVVESFKVFIRYASYLVLPLFIYNLIRFIKVDVAFVFLALIPYILLPFGKFYLVEELTGLSRYSFVFSHPNHFAYYLVPIAAYFLFITKRDYVLTYSFAFSAVLFMLLLSKSSGGIFVILVLILYKYRTKLVRPSGLFLLATISPLLFIFGFADKFLDQIMFLNQINLSDLLSRDNLGGSGSLSWRLVYWLMILKSFFDSDILHIIFGNGLATMSYGSYAYSFMYTDPHNDFIRILVEQGIIGLILFVLLLVLIIRKFKILSMPLLILIFMPMFIGNIIVNPVFVLLTIVGFLDLYRKQYYEI
ncbi:O-antigen ligase family protein [Shewanella sp. DAU305]|uniref:O-antigen ligase family protein n=1 Tax=Shewanella sp. DAU305 TaxID=2991940 RepID=UPI002283A8C6|nr:O-antigen ligase family protein [Shewanella sp. DAU305]WAL80252.1 O-antigen ligase family protein [Shewanella sp. DAU305]